MNKTGIIYGVNGPFRFLRRPPVSVRARLLPAPVMPSPFFSDLVSSTIFLTVSSVHWKRLQNLPANISPVVSA